MSIDGGGKRQGAVLRCQFTAPPHSFTQHCTTISFWTAFDYFSLFHSTALHIAFLSLITTFYYFSLFHSALHCTTLSLGTSLLFPSALHCTTFSLLHSSLCYYFIMHYTVLLFHSFIVHYLVHHRILPNTALKIAFCLVFLQAEPKQGHRLFSRVFGLFFSAHNLYICSDLFQIFGLIFR